MFFPQHNLYSELDLSDWHSPLSGVFVRGDFIEFEMATLAVFGKRIPIAGGGYFRLMPWTLTRWMIRRYLANHSLYCFYLHPFELSARNITRHEVRASWKDRVRYGIGRKKTFHQNL